MAINPRIKQKAEDIRKKIFGTEVRESLASGIEAISEDVEATIGRQDYVEEQFQDVLDETTDKDVISAPELIAARNGKSNLKTRLDDEHAQVTAQLQQTEQSLNAQLAQKASKEELSNVLDGSPKGVYATLAELQTAFPSGSEGVYIVTADGHIYSWSGTAWTDRGLYQAAGIAKNSVGAAESKIMKWAEISGTKLLNINMTEKTASIDADAYIFNDDGYKQTTAQTITFNDANATYICVDRVTGTLYSKNITVASKAHDYILCRIQAGKIFTPYGYKNITINNAKVTSAFTDEKLVVGEASLDDNIIGVAKIKLKKWAEVTVNSSAQKLNINTVNKTATLTKSVYITNGDGYVLATGPQTITYNDVNPTYICVNRLTGTLFAQDITTPTTTYTFILCRIVLGKVFCPFGYRYIQVNGDKITGADTNFELPDKFITREKLAFDINAGGKKRLYSIVDAWNAWKQGLKFPIAILGDSTTESTTDPIVYNTIGTDHRPTGAYTTLLEELIRTETGNATARIYNAGFSSKNAVWALANINEIIKTNSNYSDVKMIGIRHGLNDPLENATTAEYLDSMRTAMRGIIDWCFANNIQPFLITPQATMIAKAKYSRPGYTSAEITNISLSIIRELASEYNLELIDNYSYTKMLQLNIDNVQSLVPDGLHYKSEGHTYQAGLLFAEFNKETIKLDKSQKIGFTNPEVRSDIAEATKATSKTNGYNSYISTTAAGKIFDVNLFNHFKYGVTLSFTFDSTGDITVKVNGTNYVLNTANKTIPFAGMGLIQIEVTNTEANNLTFYGLEVS